MNPHSRHRLDARQVHQRQLLSIRVLSATHSNAGCGRSRRCQAAQGAGWDKIKHGEVSTVQALASYIAALGGKLDLIADIGGYLLKMPANPAA